MKNKFKDCMQTLTKTMFKTMFQKMICFCLIASISAPSFLFAAKGTQVQVQPQPNRWDVEERGAVTSLSTLWHQQELPYEVLKLARNTTDQDFTEFKKAIETHMEQFAIKELHLRNRNYDSAAVDIINLESFFAGDVGTILGSNLRFEHFIKIMKRTNISLDPAQMLGALNLFFTREWMIAHFTSNAKSLGGKTLDTAVQEQNIQQMSNELLIFLEKARASNRTDVILDTKKILSGPQQREFYSAMGLNYQDLKQLEYDLQTLKSYNPNPTLQELAKLYNKDIVYPKISKQESPAGILDEHKRVNGGILKYAGVDSIFWGVGVYTAIMAFLFLLPDSAHEIDAAIETSGYWTYRNSYLAAALVRFLFYYGTLASKLNAGKKARRAEMNVVEEQLKNKLLEQHRGKRAQILSRFQNMGVTFHCANYFL